MKHSLKAACLALCLAGAAAAEAPASCAPQIINLAAAGSAAEASVRLACDIDRALAIDQRAGEAFGPGVPALMRIVETGSPSGSAYVYSVYEDMGGLMLDVRSVPPATEPARKAQLCRLQTAIPDDLVSEIASAMNAAATSALPAYGPREEITINPDGTRTVRLILDGEDVITSIDTASGPRNFSRHIKSDDDIGRLNTRIIDVANQSPDWSCQTARSNKQ